MNVQSATSSTTQPRRSRAALLISVTSGFYMGAVMAWNFALPLLATELGASKGEVGVLLGLFVFTGGAVALSGGALGDYLGRRRTILAAVAITLVAQSGLAIVTWVPTMYALQILGGIGLGATQATLFAAAADAAGSGRLGRAMGTLTVGVQIGALTGPAVAGLALAWFDARQVLALTASSYLVSLLLVLVGLNRLAVRRRSQDVLKDIIATIRQWPFLTATVATFAWGMVWPPLLSFAPLIGKEFLHMPIYQVGLLVAGLGVVSALFAVPAGRIVDGVRDKQALLAVTALATGGLVIVFGQTTGPMAGIVVLTVASLVASVSGIAVGLSHFGLASAQARGLVMGLLLTTLNLASGLGAAVFGFLLQHFGYGGGLSILGASAICITALAVLLRIARKPALARAN